MKLHFERRNCDAKPNRYAGVVDEEPHHLSLMLGFLLNFTTTSEECQLETFLFCLRPASVLLKCQNIHRELPLETALGANLLLFLLFRGRF